MKKVSPRRRYNIYSLVTILIIVLSFGYYYFYYIPAQEVYFHEKGFRIITRIADNAEKQHQNYVKIVSNYFDPDNLNNRGENYHLPGELSIDTLPHTPSGTKKWIADEHCTVSFPVTSLQEAAVYCRFGIMDLFSNKLRYDFFNAFVVFDQHQVCYSDIPVSSTGIWMDSIKAGQTFISTKLLEIEFNHQKHQMYVVPVNLSEEHTLFVGGIIDNAFFRNQTHSLSPSTVSFIIIFLALFILSLPLLKLLLISESERFKTIDAFTGLLAIIIGAAFLMQLLIYNYQNTGPARSMKHSLLQSYSDTISANFIHELKAGLALVNECDKDLKNTAENNNYNSVTAFDKRYNSLGYPEDSIQESMIFWVNGQGEQLVKWGKKTITPRVNVSQRDYFRKVYNGQTWELSGGANDSLPPFYLEYIRSWTENLVYAMLSCNTGIDRFERDNGRDDPSLHPKVVSLGMGFASLDQVNTIGNVSYMLIDEKGQVLSHKDKSRDLQENIIEETNHNSRLKEALFGKKDKFFKAFYNSGKRLFYINPIDDLPLYLLVYLDEDYEKVVDIQVLALSSELYALLLMIFIFELGLFAFINRKRHIRLAGNKLYFQWIWPVRDNRNLYVFLSLFILCAYIIYYLAGLHHNLLQLLSVVLVLLTSNLVVLQYSLIKKLKKVDEKGKSYRILTTFYIIMTALAILLFHLDKSGTIYAILGFYLIFGLSLMMVFMGSGFIKGTPWLRFIARINRFMDKRLAGGRLNYKVSYYFYLFLVICAIGVFPSIDSFIKANNFEREMYQRNCQYSLLKNYRDRLASRQGHNNIQNSWYLIKSFRNHDTAQVAPEYILTKKEMNLIESLRYPVSDKCNNDAILGLLNRGGDSSIYWQRSPDRVTLRSEVDPIKVSSPRFTDQAKTSVLDIRSRIIFYGLLTFLLATVLFVLLRFWSRKVFLLDVEPVKIRSVQEALQRSDFVYVISTSLSKARDFLANSDYVQYELDLLEVGSSEELHAKVAKLSAQFIRKNKNDKQGFNVLVIDSNPRDEKAYGLKAEALHMIKKKISGAQYTRLIVLSTSHPSFTTNVFYDIPEKQDVFNHYKAYVNEIAPSLRCFYPVNPDLRTRAEERSLYGIFTAARTGKKLDEPFDVDGEVSDSEEATIKTQVELQNYYYGLWNNLEAREQHLVYDIAQNGLANYKNRTLINNLMNKGILRRDENNTLVIFSKSFMNFILSIINREQALQVETQAKRSGNWSNLRFPLIMIFIAAFALLFIAEQDIFNDVVGWLLAASASVPILLRTFAGLSNVFVSKSKEGNG